MRIWKFDRFWGIKYYIPAKSEILQICQFTSRNESKRGFKSGSNLNQIWNVFQIWIDQLMRAIWVCSILLQIFSKFHPTLYNFFYNFLMCVEKIFLHRIFFSRFFAKSCISSTCAPDQNFRIFQCFFLVFSSMLLRESYVGCGHQNFAKKRKNRTGNFYRATPVLFFMRKIFTIQKKWKNGFGKFEFLRVHKTSSFPGKLVPTRRHVFRCPEDCRLRP